MAITKTDLCNMALSSIGSPPSLTDVDVDSTTEAIHCRTNFNQARKAVLRCHPWNFAIDRQVISAAVISNCVDNGSGLIRVTALGHDLTPSAYIVITGVQGTTEANGNWVINVIDGDTFDLVGSTFANAYSSGGYAALAPQTDYTYLLEVPTNILRFISEDNDADYQIESGYFATDTPVLHIRGVIDKTNYDTYDPLCIEALICYLGWKISYAITQSMKVKEDAWQAFDAILKKARFVDSVENPRKVLNAEEWVESRINGTGGFVRDPKTN